MIFLSAQPWDKYFLWQVEVQIVNFRKHNISDKMHVLIWYPPHGELKGWEELSKKYPEVKMFAYPDKGVDLKLYIPQLRPHIIKEHFKLFPELSKEVIFYHDSDIIFNYLPNFELLTSDDICWQSNTTGYLDYSYLRSKEKQGKIREDLAVAKLAKIGGVDVATIKSYDKKTGGAQYLLKGVDSEFWQDVEDQCIEIRKQFYWGEKSQPNPGSVNNEHFPNENAGFQSWCADMWAVNFSLWKRGKETNITPELDFSWATDSAETYQRKPIFHNAGATHNNHKIFHKGSWINRSPIGKHHKVAKNTASYYYVQAIEAVS